ncbi:MAG: hypothetical protein IJT49_01600 [Clostridia bacterium]|nr:hypothetical protein [Clostridia bacterium]
MKAGRAFELFVKHILMNIGFSEVSSDGIYVFDGAPGQMLQGLGEAHNADVLLDPPVQTPFYSRTRLLIECKDYQSRVGIGTVRSVLGLREDINHFDIVDKEELLSRRRQNRRGVLIDYERYSYQVAIAAINGFTQQAQKFAATYRIPLISFERLPFWSGFLRILKGFNPEYDNNTGRRYTQLFDHSAEITEEHIISFSNEIGNRMAVAITGSGQLLFLYRECGEQNQFDDYYSLHWSSPDHPWILRSGDNSYKFQLPESIMKQWLDNSSNDLEMKREAFNCKANYLSNMIVYYSENGRPFVKMISIDKYGLENARERLR